MPRRATIQLRRDTKAKFDTEDPILADGEFAWVEDEKLFRIGRGVQPFGDLPNMQAVNEVLPVADPGDKKLWSNGGILSVGPAGVLPAPVARADSYGLIENQSLQQLPPGVLANDTPGTVAELVTQPANGTVVLSPNGSFLYTPDTDFVGTDTWTYKVIRAPDESVAAVVTMEVIAETSDAIGTSDNYAMQKDTTLVVQSPGVMNNDLNTNTVLLDTDVSNGTLVLNSDGSFSYTPTPGFDGLDSFTYLPLDIDGVDGTAVTVTIDVIEVVLPPPVDPPDPAPGIPLRLKRLNPYNYGVSSPALSSDAGYRYVGLVLGGTPFLPSDGGLG